MSYCQGFCRTCGTGCAEYCAEIARWKAKAEDRGEKLEKTLTRLEALLGSDLARVDEVKE
jgi:hypothetical protein